MKNERKPIQERLAAIENIKNAPYMDRDQDARKIEAFEREPELMDKEDAK